MPAWLAAGRTGDRKLAKRLAREAQAAARVQARHAQAVRKREAARAQARQALPARLLVTAVAGAAIVPAGGLVEGLLWPVAVVAGLKALGAWQDLRRPAVPPLAALPAGPVAAPPPPPGSAAWPAVRRLEVVRGELTRLVPLVGPAGRPAADDAWHAAAEADAALRWQAARLGAVEPHLGADPDLLRPLYDGVACQERLVAAVADLVAASADPLAPSRLQDATDRLHGLAQGLREVRDAAARGGGWSA